MANPLEHDEPRIVEITKENLLRKDRYRWQMQPTNKLRHAILYSAIYEFNPLMADMIRQHLVEEKDKFLMKQFQFLNKEEQFRWFMRRWMVAKVPEQDLRDKADVVIEETVRKVL